MSTELTPQQVRDEFARAVECSRAAVGVSSPNPPVGAVILDADGVRVGEGATQPVGGPHAEIMALRAAGDRARNGTAVVTLEPCNHTGRTGPCSEALTAAGISTVFYGVADPNPTAAGGADALRAAGVRVIAGLDVGVSGDVENGPLRAWLHRQRTGRPLITAKIASGIDGRIAAPDGTSQWITSEVARAHAHEQRANIDAIVVGTRTVLADDPSLTARWPDGTLRTHQPTRIILGHSDIPADAKILDAASTTIQVRSHNPRDVVAALPNALWVLVEGGPSVLGAFFSADLIDEVDFYLAPAVLGAGKSSVDIGSATTISDLRRFAITDVLELGEDVLIRMRT